MSKERLPKYTLTFNEKKDQWDLQKDGSKKVVESFDTKKEARGVLKEAVGKNGGSVKIQTQDGTFQEERTYPRSADPKSTEG